MRRRKRQETAGSGHDFHSHVIEAAFYGAVARYDLQAMPFHLALFRPRLRPAHQLGPGRAINADRRRIYHDNGWAPFVRRVEVFEMPGDHDSMVLEPNVARAGGPPARQPGHRRDQPATAFRQRPRGSRGAERKQRRNQRGCAIPPAPQPRGPGVTPSRGHALS